MAKSLKTWPKPFRYKCHIPCHGLALVPEEGDVEQSPRLAGKTRRTWVCVGWHALRMSPQQSLAELI